MSSNGLSLLMGSVMLLLSVFVYAQMQQLGFPDGHLTDLDRVERQLGTLFVGVSVLVGGWSVGLRWLVSAPNQSRAARITALGYGVFLAVIYLIDRYLSGILDNGVGG